MMEGRGEELVVRTQEAYAIEWGACMMLLETRSRRGIGGLSRYQRSSLQLPFRIYGSALNLLLDALAREARVAVASSGIL
jgi:hypothetical protein